MNEPADLERPTGPSRAGRILGWLLVLAGGALASLGGAYALFFFLYTAFGGTVEGADVWWRPALVLGAGLAASVGGFTLLGVRSLLVRVLLAGVVLTAGLMFPFVLAAVVPRS